MVEDSENVEGVAGPSVPYAQRQKEALNYFPPRRVQCIACADAFRPHEVVHCPCDHSYCEECLKSLFIRATTDETLFPPRCCRQPIPIFLIKDHLSCQELSNFAEAAVEFKTAKRIYCVRPDCGKFVPPSQISAMSAVCLRCATQMCVHCHNRLHTGDCPEDEALQAVLQLADGNGWRRCFGCNAMVELATGCNHMTYDSDALARCC